MAEIRNISIIGLGALGVLYGNYFTKALGREAVSFVADQTRIKKYQEQGVYCNGQKCDFPFTDGSEVERPADLFLFAVKAGALSDAIAASKNLIDPDTIILSVLNGISSEAIIGEAFGQAHLLYCIAQGMDAVKLGNQLTYSHIGQLCIGVPENEPEKLPMLLAVMELFDKIQLPYTKEADIRHRLWSKWMLNVGVNQVVMVYEGTYGTVQQEGTPREMMKAAMREVIALAEKEQVPVTEEDLNSYLALMDTLSPDGMPSMRQDGIAKRNSEVELFAGTVIRESEKHGLDAPVNKELYHMVKKLEAEY